MSTLAAPSVQRQMAAGKRTAQGRSTPLLQRQTMPCWSNGTMPGTVRTEIFLTKQHYKATSLFGGAVMDVQRARCTAGRLAQLIEPLAANQQDALFVLGIKFASATLWKLSVLILLQTLMLRKMVSVLLKSQLQPASLSIAGCLMSLATKSDP